MKAFIYTGGHVFIDGVTEFPGKEDFVIAVENGYQICLSLGIQPNIVLGDFDSSLVPIETENTRVLKYPKEKDDTDTQIAVQIAIDKGVESIVLIGGLSGRLDHTLSSLGILIELWEKKIVGCFTDGKNRVRYLKNTSTIVGKSESYKYLSIIAVDEKIKGVTIEGCKYPLKNATLFRNRQYAISNEIVGNCAFLEVRKGGIFMIESIDV